MNMKKSISILMAAFAVSLSVACTDMATRRSGRNSGSQTAFHTFTEHPIQRNYVRASGRFDDGAYLVV